MQFLLSNSSQQIFRLTSFEKNWKLLEAKIMQCTFLLRMYFSKQNSKTDITIAIAKGRGCCTISTWLTTFVIMFLSIFAPLCHPD